MLDALPFTPSTHDIRRAFVTTMSPRLSNFVVEGVRLKKSDISMITHANEGRNTTASAVYDKNEYLDTKYKILEEWEQWCLEGYYRIKNKKKVI